ncbi:hypothetical protein D1012_02765 [Pseudotabrizicola alkalilacus]|uniref:Uncharacterized protein n=1 Tax=Pseudotabrizicola alkalilacus TaxID=2305252 RepID=A0A411Z7L4_9RHOB|nr:hypothetical protein D1012_02765 [Pseudotabrizicola alkalilacus]
MLVQRHATTFIIQTAHRANDFQEFARFSQDNGATWSAWSRTVSQRSLLGTVSQSSGVPTGAVIERGSNANGEYVRFADGHQVCRTVAQTIDIATAVGSVFRGLGSGVSWPAAFSAVPFVVHMPTDSANLWGGNQLSSSATNAVLRLMAPTSVTGVQGWSLGIGRWF